MTLTKNDYYEMFKADEKRIGGYCKSQLLRHKIVELMNVTTYDKIKIHDNEQQVKCMVDLELIDHEQADVILNMYKRLEQEVETNGKIGD